MLIPAVIITGDGSQISGLRVFDFMGRLLYSGVSDNHSFIVNNSRGMLLFQFQNTEGSQLSKKVVCNANNLQVILTHHRDPDMKPKESKKFSQSSQYTLTFEDLVPDDPEFKSHQQNS